MQPCSNSQIDKLIELFKSVQKNFRNIAFSKFKECGFTITQLSLISVLHSTPKISLGELTEKLGLSKSTVSSLVERMENQGIVVREIPRNNRRTVMLSLNENFVTKHRDIVDFKTILVNDIFMSDRLNAEDAETIIKGLEVLSKLFSNEREE